MGQHMHKLLWCAYTTGHRIEHMLIYPLAERENLLCCLHLKDIAPSDSKIIKLGSRELEKLPLSGKTQWIRNNCPGAMKGYKSLRLDRVKIISTYDIPLEDTHGKTI